MSFRTLSLCAVVSVLAAACGDFRRGPASGTAGGSGGGGGGASGPFATDVEPLLIANCQACHVANGPAGSTRYLLTGDAATDYTAVIALINKDAPDQSLLLQKASGAAGHGGGTRFATSSPEYATILAWIQSGAPQ